MTYALDATGAVIYSDAAAFPLSLEHVASGQAALAQFRIAEQSFEARLDARHR